MSTDRPSEVEAPPSAPVSRPSKTNPADHDFRSHGPSTRESLNRPLTERDGVDLRAEVCEATSRGVDAISWRRAVQRWRDYIRESGETAAVFGNGHGDTVTGSNPNRFMPDYSDKQYAKLKDLERGIRADYRSPHTAMLTLTASSTTDEGEPLPPVDHLDELLGSWSAVTRALRRALDGRRYERLAILEPHKSGYLHVHIAVFVDGMVRDETFRPVIEAHLRNCETAEADAHRVEDEGVVSVNEVGGDRGEGQLENLGTYLAEYLGTYGDDPLDAPDHQQMANAILWATGRQRWRPSNGAQSYMATNRSESVSEWEFIGIEDRNGEIHEVPSGGGVARMTTCTDVLEDDPPPDESPTWGPLVEDWTGG